MSELLVELFSEEIPSNLQIHTRQQLENLLKQNLSSSNLKPKSLEVFSTPTRLTIHITGLPKIIKIPAAEIKGPKMGVPESVINNYAKSKNLKQIQNKHTQAKRSLQESGKKHAVAKNRRNGLGITGLDDGTYVDPECASEAEKS